MDAVERVEKARLVSFDLPSGGSVIASVGYIDESGGIWPEMLHLRQLYSARGKVARRASPRR